MLIQRLRRGQNSRFHHRLKDLDGPLGWWPARQNERRGRVLAFFLRRPHRTDSETYNSLQLQRLTRATIRRIRRDELLDAEVTLEARRK